MPNLFISDPGSYSIRQKYFFHITHSLSATKVLMICKNSIVNTDQLPSIYKDLAETFPAVLSTKCFNDDNLPFTLEVRRTEIAHLFEHILIEYIYELKTERGIRNIKIRGITEWNWKLEPYGTFNLLIDVGRADKEVFNLAFQKTVLLFNSLVNSSTYERQTANIPQSVFQRQV